MRLRMVVTDELKKVVWNKAQENHGDGSGGQIVNYCHFMCFLTE